MFGVPSAEGMSVFQIAPVDKLWLKYTYTEFKRDTVTINTYMYLQVIFVAITYW